LLFLWRLLGRLSWLALLRWWLLLWGLLLWRLCAGLRGLLLRL